MSRMSKACNYIEKNIQEISGFGFLVHPEWEKEVEEFAERLKEIIKQADEESNIVSD